MQVRYLTKSSQAQNGTSSIKIIFRPTWDISGKVNKQYTIEK